MRALKKELDITEVTEHRTESCRHYDRCLSEACNQRMRSFSCQDCEEYEFKPIRVVLLNDKSHMYPEENKRNHHANK